MICAEARARVDRQVAEGPLPPLEAQVLRAHLRGCDACRRYYDRAVDLEALLEGRDVPEAQVERLVALGPPPPARRRLPVVPIGLAVAAAAAVTFVALRDEPPEFQARGGGGGVAASFAVFALRDGEPRRTETVRRGEGLLFAYTNPTGSAHRFVIIAGRDAAGRAHWFHPAFASPDDDPRSVPVEAGVADRELPEAVYVDAAPGPMQVCAVFTASPLRVRDADLALERDGSWPPGARVCKMLTVSP